MNLESNPHSMLEGVVIAGYAVLALLGYLYVRAEYPLATRDFRKPSSRLRNSNVSERIFLGVGFTWK